MVYTKQDSLDVDALNAQVDSIMSDILLGKLKKNPMAGNEEAVEAVKNGAVVYQKRKYVCATFV